MIVPFTMRSGAGCELPSIGWLPVVVTTMFEPWTTTVDDRFEPAFGGVLTLVTVSPVGIGYVTLPPW